MGSLRVSKGSMAILAVSLGCSGVLHQLVLHWQPTWVYLTQGFATIMLKRQNPSSVVGIVLDRCHSWTQLVCTPESHVPFLRIT